MDYQKLKKLDEESARKMQDKDGPADECICRLLAPPGGASAMQSVRKSVMRAVNASKRRFSTQMGMNTTRETLKRTNKCGKCGCDDHPAVMKTSYANIRIATPDLTSICPCPTTTCMPDKDKYPKLDVTIEHVQIKPELKVQSHHELKTLDDDTPDGTPDDTPDETPVYSLATSRTPSKTSQLTATSTHSEKKS